MGYYTNSRTRKAIDGHLFDLTLVESNMGTDTTADEKFLSNNEKRVIIKKIRDLDELYYQDVFNIDKKENL